MIGVEEPGHVCRWEEEAGVSGARQHSRHGPSGGVRVLCTQMHATVAFIILWIQLDLVRTVSAVIHVWLRKAGQSWSGCSAVQLYCTFTVQLKLVANTI
jgi:hypothetical protein